MEKDNILKSNSNKKIYFVAIISKIFIVFLSLLTSAMINRSLGVELKGEYAYINNLVSISVVVLSLGFGQTYSTYRRKYGKEVLNTFTSLIILASLITLILFILSFIFGMNYNIKMTLIISVLSVLKTNILYIAAVEDVKKRDFNNIIYKIIYTILVFFVFIIRVKSLTILLLLVIVDDLIIIVGTFINYKLKLDFVFIKNNKKELKKIIKLGIISMTMYLLITLNYNVDILMLKKFSTVYYVGLYSVGVSLANMIWLIPDAFKDVLVYKTSKEDSVDEIVTITKFNLYIGIIITVGFVIFGKLFLKIMYGDEFLPSYGSTIILFIGCLSMIIYKLIHPLYVSKGKQKLVLNILLISVIVNIILNFFLIRKINILGASLASVISYSICSTIFLYVFCKEYKVNIVDFVVIRKKDLLKIKNLFKSKKVK